MEKFKRYTDEATGVNPFVPYRKKLSDSTPAVLKFILNPLRMILLSPILFLFKLILILIFMLPYIAIQYVSIIIPIYAIKRLLHRYSSILCCGASLFTLLGFSTIKSKHVDLEGKEKPNHSTTLNHGDLIICNYVSFIELFYLNFKYSPTFAMIVKSSIENGESNYGVRPCGFFSALSYTFFGQFNDTQTYSDCKSLPEIIKQAREYKQGPVVIFPEAVTSNGRSVLKFQNNVFQDMEQVLRENKNYQVRVIGFKYTYEEFSPAYHLGNFWPHLFKVLTQFYNSLHVAHIYLNADDMKTLEQNFSVTAIKKIVLPKVLGIVSVNSSPADRERFLKEWNKGEKHE
ncbi:hypothetical protein C9374_009874 [Naegleria lovaniensis]|uniref:Phospholipid/glycerol acyltransferase domain-containing protein n=1 Tax=Naegleria lovaniensis TaxID=51637 RepID=A0AA88GEU4_NAELO|nr:uncharacterized protein C9374_009874 [Naegleria lovaniensis]KAG2375251.1 hypothetical protein C9374_009874 [Naegleria lovaniensis]